MRRVSSIVALCILFLHAITAHAEQEFVSLAYHDVRKDVQADFDDDQFAISTRNLAAHFAWLDHHGYTPVSIDDLVAAARDKRPLPEKAVLLSFDDGLKSVYTDVYPLLKVFNYPAVVSVVTDWLELAPGQTIKFGLRQRGVDDFLNWDDIREMQASGLVEIASHSANLHRGIVANPQANVMPAAISRAYLDGRYESDEEFRERVSADLARSALAIRQALGSYPQVITWPYGKYAVPTLEIAKGLGMPISLTLDTGTNTVRDISRISRILVRENPGINALSAELMLPPRDEIVRAAQVDLDYVYDGDPVQQRANLDELLERIKDLQISHVFLQAFADPDADGAASALYFPNRHLPVQSDLFSRVAWQLKTRSAVKVFAWLPLLAFDSVDFNPAWQVLDYEQESSKPDLNDEPRLSPYHPEARRVIREIYEDLASYAEFDGILFGDDGRLNESEDASTVALDAYRQEFGSDFSIPLAHDDAELGQKWSSFKTQTLIDFGNELAGILREQKPQLKTARNLFAPAILDASSKTWLAQSLSLFLTNYDYVALKATPYTEESDDPDRYLAELALSVGQHDKGMERTIFELQAFDWRRDTEVPAVVLSRQMRQLQAAGAKHLAYYPDNFIVGRPGLDQIRQGISLADYPFKKR